MNSFGMVWMIVLLSNLQLTTPMHMVVYLTGTVIVILVVKAAKIRLSDYLL